MRSVRRFRVPGDGVELLELSEAAPLPELDRRITLGDPLVGLCPAGSEESGSVERFRLCGSRTVPDDEEPSVTPLDGVKRFG